MDVLLLLRTLGGSEETLLAGSGVDALVLVLCVSLEEPHVDGWFTVGSGCCLLVRSVSAVAPVGHMHFQIFFFFDEFVMMAGIFIGSVEFYMGGNLDRGAPFSVRQAKSPQQKAR